MLDYSKALLMRMDLKDYDNLIFFVVLLLYLPFICFKLIACQIFFKEICYEAFEYKWGGNTSAIMKIIS